MPGVGVIRLELDPDLPIVGCELTPKLLLRMPDGKTSTADVPESAPICGTYLRYKWYRVLKDKNVVRCHLHPEQASTFQCDFCSMRKSLMAKSHHCSLQCYQQAWASYHRDAHAKSLAAKEPTLSYNPHGAFAPKKEEPQCEVGQSITYTPTTEDLGYVLRFDCAVRSANSQTVLGEINSISTPPVVPYPTPIPRKLINVSGVDETGNPGSFTVLTYNILSDTAANTSKYSYCPLWARSWTYRRLNLLEEIVGYSADVVCLQDVQQGHLENFFAPELKKHGYDFRYTKRINEILKGVPSVLDDGCATFFKRDKFTLVEKYDIELNETAQALIEATIPSDSQELASKRLVKDNIALVVLLEPKFGQPVNTSEKRQRICVANACVNMKQDLKDVKLWQIHTLLNRMENIADNTGPIPMILCGDFNIVPLSAPHLLFVTKMVSAWHEDLRKDPFGILKPHSKLTHQLPLESAYSAFLRVQRGTDMDKYKASINSMNKEPLFTKYTKDIMGCHDYIFYTAPTLRVEALLELVDVNALRKYTAIPSKEWPSGHIALLAQFSCVANTRQ